MTLGEISELWRQQEESDGQELSRTTFNRHRDSILDIFGVIIECDRKDGYRYYIENEEVLPSARYIPDANIAMAILLRSSLLIVLSSSC